MFLQLFPTHLHLSSREAGETSLQEFCVPLLGSFCLLESRRTTNFLWHVQHNHTLVENHQRDKF